MTMYSTIIYIINGWHPHEMEEELQAKQHYVVII